MDTSATLADTLNRLLFERKMRVTDLARAIDVPQPTLHRMVTGKSPNPHRNSLEPIAQFFKISVDQLTGKAPLPNTLVGNSMVHQSGALQHIPLYSWTGASDKQDQQGAIISHPKSNPKCFATTLESSAMEPQFSAGTTLVFDPDKLLKDRALVLVKVPNSDAPLFRQLLTDGEFQYFKALNPDLNAFPMRVKQQDDKILGTLVEARRNYEDI